MKNKTKTVKIALLLFFSLLGIMSLFLGMKKGMVHSFDFQWDAAKIFAMGEDPYEISLDTNCELNGRYGEYYGAVEANQFPSLLMLLFPYTLFEPKLANVLWALSNLLFLTGIIILLKKTFWKEMEMLDFALFSALLVSSSPVRRQFALGQHTLFSVFFFLLAYYFILDNENDKNKNLLFKDIISGIALAISYFKYSITAPMMLIFIYKKKYRPVIISIVIHILLTIVSATYLHKSPVYMILAPLKVAGLLSSEGFADIGSILGQMGMSGMITLAPTVLIFIALTIFAFLKKDIREDSLMSFLIFVSLIFMYHRSYDFFVLIIPLTVMLNDYKESDKKITDKIRIFSIIWVILEIFIMDTFIDPLTGTGMKMQSLFGFYDSVYNIYIYTVIALLYLCIFTYKFMPKKSN